MMTGLDTRPVLLVTTAHPSLYHHPGPHGEAWHPNLGRLLQPRHTSSAALTAAAGIPWAADNDAFVPPPLAAELGAAAFDRDKQDRFVRMLDRLAGLEGCRFVTVPDVVANAAETARLFEHWRDRVTATGLPVGLVAQNGQDDVGVPWEAIDALFIGGDDAFKPADETAELAREAKRRGKWVHWGRVNTRSRIRHCLETEACDSLDGSSWARWRLTHLDKGLRWVAELAATPPLIARGDGLRAAA